MSRRRWAQFLPGPSPGGQAPLRSPAVGGAARFWGEALAGWGVPERILAQAPESPWGFSPALFAAAADDALARTEPTPSNRRALEALPAGGSVLDVGCGGGAASPPLAPRARRIVGVDSTPEMLVEFARRAGALGNEHEEVEGAWPEAAARVETADVVLCHHVLYNVRDPDPFVRALTGRARRRVVMEVSDTHPRAWLTPYWKRFWDLDRPGRPTGDDAIAMVRETGADAHAERYEVPGLATRLTGQDMIDFIRRALCLHRDRDDEIARAVEEIAMPQSFTAVVIWWDAGTATA